MAKEFSIVICIHRRSGAAHPSCAGRGAEAIADALEKVLPTALPGVALHRVHCLGECGRGPNLRIAPGGRFFHGMTLEQIPQLLDELRRLSEGE